MQIGNVMKKIHKNKVDNINTYNIIIMVNKILYMDKWV